MRLAVTIIVAVFALLGLGATLLRLRSQRKQVETREKIELKLSDLQSRADEIKQQLGDRQKPK